jgi:multicomponent Na+:H+ antiporter subunit F
MTGVLLWVAVALLVSMLVVLPRALARDATTADRLLVPLLFGTTGAALLIVVGEALARPALRDVALTLIVVAAVVTGVFARSLVQGR